jgi:hypothetical protein
MLMGVHVIARCTGAAAHATSDLDDHPALRVIQPDAGARVQTHAWSDAIAKWFRIERRASGRLPNQTCRGDASGALRYAPL